jgi:siderophore synthetase component
MGDRALSPSFAERELAARVLDALLREGYGGLPRRVERGAGGGPVLRLPGPAGAAVPLRPSGFLQDLAVCRPSAVTLDQVLDALARVAEPADAEGVAAFGRECREALAATRLHERCHARVLARLDRRRRADERVALGVTTWYDALAAYVDHPVYPTSRGRRGLVEADLVRYAPELAPTFALRWAAVPRPALVGAGTLPRWWPVPADVGLPAGLGRTHELVPVHPLTARRPPVEVAPRARVRVAPTLSMRTVAVAHDPGVHLKVPLPTSTLGLRNRRGLAPGTLEDGALLHRLLQAVLAREPDLRERVLLADDGTYGHAGREELGYLVRRFPAGLDDARVVPVAALLAPAPGGRLVVEELAAECAGGDVIALLDRYLALLFDLNVALFVRYGIALEAHQQNVSVVLQPGGTGVGLLLKDYDGTLLHHEWLDAGLGGAAPRPDELRDQRLLTGDPHGLVDVFVTITVHLCAGALAFGLADRGVVPLGRLLGLVRHRLERSLARHAGSPRADLLRARVLEAERLPGKAMVIAGTLVDKARTGARDVNKHYGADGPNYLRTARWD